MDIKNYVTCRRWMELPFFNEKPKAKAIFKQKPNCFIVNEVLPFSPSGEGEHIYLFIEKEGQNTTWVASQLARYGDVPPKSISFAGLKDRYGLTRQWFSVHLPGKSPAQTFADKIGNNIPNVQVLGAIRHHKKLQRGTLKGNHFSILLNEYQGSREETDKRLQTIINQGVPNYFGYQRFGLNGENITNALKLFNGQLKTSRAKRSIFLSSVRAFIFNFIVANRVASQTWETLKPGDVLTFSDNQSLIFPENQDWETQARFKQGNLLLTAPLWGQGPLRSGSEIHKLETQLASFYPEMCQGLERMGLKQERRAMRLSVSKLKRTWENESLTLSFFLPKGGYATTVLKEVIDFKDASLNQ